MNRQNAYDSGLKRLFLNHEYKYFYLLVLFMLLQPLIDVITSLGVRYSDSGISFGMASRSIFLLISVGYIFLVVLYRPKKKYILFYLVILAIYFVFFLWSVLLNPALNPMDNIKEIIKIVYLPVTLISFSLAIEKAEVDRLIKLITVVFYVYSMIVLVGFITGTGYSTYGYLGLGSQGWFYSGNEVSAILSFLIPLALVVLLEKSFQKKSISSVFYGVSGILLVIFVNNQMGTKALVASSILFIVIYGIIYFYRYSRHRGFQNASKGAVCFLIAGTILLSLQISPLNKNMGSLMANIDTVIEDENEKENDAPHAPESTKPEETGRLYNIVNVLLSNRLLMARPVHNAYMYASPLEKAIGIGYYPQGTRLSRLVEIDILAILYRHGYVGLSLILLPYFLVLQRIFRTIVKKRKRPSSKSFTLAYVTLLTLGFAILTGHTFVAPSVSFFVSLCSVMMLRYVTEDDLF